MSDDDWPGAALFAVVLMPGILLYGIFVLFVEGRDPKEFDRSLETDPETMVRAQEASVMIAAAFWTATIAFAASRLAS